MFEQAKWQENGKLKLLIIVGTRPEIIRLAAVITKRRIFCHDTNNFLDNLGRAARLARIGTQRKRCLHTKTPPMSC